MEPMRLELPVGALDGIQIPSEGAEARLRLELAIHLYCEGLASAGAASTLAGVDRATFWGQLAVRKIPRHYGDEELREDVTFARE